MSVRPARAGVVVGLALVLVFAAGLATQVFGPAPRAREASEVFAELFDLPAELPFDLALRDAVELPSGDVVAVLAAPGYERGIPVPERADTEGSEGSKGSKGSEHAEPTGSAAEPAPRPEPPRDTPPVEAVLTVYRRSAPVVALFSKLDIDEHPRDRGHGHWAMEFGRLEWDRFQASFVHERAGAGASFRDSLRVNLSAGERYAVLSVQWPAGHVASQSKLEELLRGLRFRGAGGKVGG